MVCCFLCFLFFGGGGLEWNDLGAVDIRGIRG